MNTDNLNIITISIRGFDADIEKIIQTFSLEPSGYRRKGDKTHPQKSTLILKNSIYFEFEIFNNELWDDAILRAMKSVGGLSTLKKVRDIFSPEYIHFDLCFAMSQSLEQKDGYVSCEVLKKLCIVGASIGFSFI